MTESKTLFRGTIHLLDDEGKPYDVSTYENHETGQFTQVNESTGEFRRRACPPQEEPKEGERYRWPEYGGWQKPSVVALA